MIMFVLLGIVITIILIGQYMYVIKFTDKL